MEGYVAFLCNSTFYIIPGKMMMHFEATNAAVCIHATQRRFYSAKHITPWRELHHNQEGQITWAKGALFPGRQLSLIRYVDLRLL